MEDRYFYVIRLGGHLYVANRFYKWFPETTQDVLFAFKYVHFDECFKQAQKCHGKVEKYKLSQVELD